jgi:hypothetical protein
MSRMDEPREWADLAFQWVLVIGGSAMWLAIALGLAFLALACMGLTEGWL